MKSLEHRPYSVLDRISWVLDEKRSERKKEHYTPWFPDEGDVFEVIYGKGRMLMRSGTISGHWEPAVRGALVIVVIANGSPGPGMYQ
jgi:hypothetical protein